MNDLSIRPFQLSLRHAKFLAFVCYYKKQFHTILPTMLTQNFTNTRYQNSDYQTITLSLFLPVFVKLCLSIVGSIAWNYF